MMKLKDSQQLNFMKTTFTKNAYDTINCPEYLKNTYKKYVKLSLFRKSYKFVLFCYGEITLNSKCEIITILLYKKEEKEGLGENAAT